MFICGSIEPGQDGVGDYTKRLSQELVRKGILVTIVALNDRLISDIQKNVAVIDEGEITSLRLPANLAEVERFCLLKEWIDVFNPDWLSLQYVPFSYHPKGLGFGLAKKLFNIGKGIKWEIMFHEIAVGMPEGSTIKEMVWGKAQKFLAKDLIKILKPSIVHTHTTVYKKQLEMFGAEVTLLPLFSNIPVAYPELILEKITNKKTSLTIDLLVFATIQFGAPIRQLAIDAVKYEKENGIKLRMVFLGRSGKAQEEWISVWQNAGLAFLQLGEHPEDKVSEVLAKAQFGIYSTPLVLTGKSGAVAAMREHGIHLLCVSGKWVARGIKVIENPFQIVAYEKGNLGHFFESAPDFSYLPTVSKVAEQFIADLLTH